MPVDQYVGGMEHAVMHQLYSRFFYKLMRDEGWMNTDEPFNSLLTQGMVLKDGAKMSKSKGNTVNPADLIETYGADTVRLFMLFAAPPEQSLEWSDAGVDGANRFLKRVWAYTIKHPEIKDFNRERDRGTPEKTLDWQTAPKAIKQFRYQMNILLKQARFDFERYQLNTVVSACMKLFNLLNDLSDETSSDGETLELMVLQLRQKCFGILLRLLAPITPHITQEIWEQLCYGKSILDAQWPRVAADALKIDVMTLVVQVNGKLRANLEVPTNTTEEAIVQLAKQHEKIDSLIARKHVKKSIYVPNKLVNLVVTE